MLGSLDSRSKEWLPESASQTFEIWEIHLRGWQEFIPEGDRVNEPKNPASLLPFFPNTETGETKVPRPGGGGGGDLLKQATLGPKAVLP